MKPEKVKNAKVKHKKIQKKKGNSTLIIAAAALILLAGAVYVVFLSGSSDSTQNNTISTLSEVRARIDAEYGRRGYGTNTPPVRDDYVPVFAPRKADKLPEYAYTNAMTLAAYRYATEHPEVLEQIPCYCGCGQHGSRTSDGRPHRFLRDCFINDKGEYDDHASFCDLCIGETLRAKNALPSGLTLSAASEDTPSTLTISDPE